MTDDVHYRNLEAGRNRVSIKTLIEGIVEPNSTVLVTNYRIQDLSWLELYSQETFNQIYEGVRNLPTRASRELCARTEITKLDIQGRVHLDPNSVSGAGISGQVAILQLEDRLILLRPEDVERCAAKNAAICQ